MTCTACIDAIYHFLSLPSSHAALPRMETFAAQWISTAFRTTKALSSTNISSFHCGTATPSIWRTPSFHSWVHLTNSHTGCAQKTNTHCTDWIIEAGLLFYKQTASVCVCGCICVCLSVFQALTAASVAMATVLCICVSISPLFHRKPCEPQTRGEQVTVDWQLHRCWSGPALHVA